MLIPVKGDRLHPRALEQGVEWAGADGMRGQFP